MPKQEVLASRVGGVPSVITTRNGVFGSTLDVVTMCGTRPAPVTATTRNYCSHGRTVSPRTCKSLPTGREHTARYTGTARWSKIQPRAVRDQNSHRVADHAREGWPAIPLVGDTPACVQLPIGPVFSGRAGKAVPRVLFAILSSYDRREYRIPKAAQKTDTA